MLQNQSYAATQYLLNDLEMTDLMEYKLMKQYHEYLIYHRITTLSMWTRENTLPTSQKHFIITAESCSTS
eukprot:3221654-Amphidinium_carterae.1